MSSRTVADIASTLSCASLNIYHPLTTVPEKHNAMDEKERAKLKSTFDVWRGLGSPPFRLSGLSWTTDKDQALWFARRYQCEHGPGRLLHGRVKRRDVHAYLEGRMRAYLAGRSESEIVAANVKVLKIEKVPAVTEER